MKNGTKHFFCSPVLQANVQNIKMPLRITSGKHLLNALLECITEHTEIMHISNGNM